MHIEHLAVWTRHLEPLRAFYQRWFDATSNERYDSANTPGFSSYFLTFPDGGCRLELMRLPHLAASAEHPAMGYAHLAVSVGSPQAVDDLVERMRADGVRVLSEPRMTGDGYYEAVVLDPDGNRVEVTT